MDLNTPSNAGRSARLHAHGRRTAGAPFARSGAMKLVAGVAGLSAAALALTACSSGAPLESVQPAAAGGTEVGLQAQDATTVFGDTGHTETVTVPEHVGYAQLSISGAQGGNDDATSSLSLEGGYGTALHGLLPVTSGDVLTLAVAGRGGNPDGNKSPGNGGWSISPYEGGRGGGGHGSQTTDGGGGGGASVVQINGQTVVVAAGGGGEGGEATKGGLWHAGGSGGKDAGYDGEEKNATPGKGGSSSHPSNDKNGSGYDGLLLKGGGGGGGGGRYPGGHGDPSSWGGTGGGGGSSLYSAMRNVTAEVQGECDFWSCHAVGSKGHGLITLTWLPPDDVTTTYVFQKTDAPQTQLLEVPGGNGTAGTLVDTWRRTVDSDNNAQAHQQWTYQFKGATGAGQLVNKKTGQCLEVNGSSGSIDQWDCDGGENQQWKLVSNPGGSTALQISVSDGWAQPAGEYYLATTADSTAVIDGTRLALSDTQGDRTAWEAIRQ